jgi:acyl carrier protein
MDESQVALKIESFIREAFQIARDDPGFGRSVDLFEAGYVDSVGVIETLAFIAETFGVEVPDTALLSDEFATIDGMARVVSVLIAADSASPAARALANA